MKKHSGSWKHAAAATCVALALTSCGKANNPGAANTAGGDKSPVVAEVNGKPITSSMFQMYVETIERQTGRPLPPEQRDEVLDQFISMHLAADAAEKAGVAKDEKVKEQLAMTRMNVLVDAHLQKYMTDHPVKDEELKPAYDKRVAEMPKEYRARHILVEDKAAADQVVKDLKAGGNFAKIAQSKSTDKGSAERGGDLDWFTLDTMVKPFSDAVAKLEKGKFTQEPVQSQFGWHVILLEDTRASAAPAFGDVKDQVRTMVQRDKLQSYLAELRKNAKIEKKALPAPPATPADPHQGMNMGEPAPTGSPH